MTTVEEVVEYLGSWTKTLFYKQNRELSQSLSEGVFFLFFLCQYVLAVGSSVFHAMFYGELAEDQDEIRIPDVEPPSFLAMLKYVVFWFIDL